VSPAHTASLITPCGKSGATERPLAVDLCAGLCGWGEGLIAEGFRIRAYDIEDMFAAIGESRPEHVDLVLRDVLTLHGSEVADAELIVASPPCQEFSYMAMPWSRAKQIARALRGEDVFPEGYRGSRTLAELTALFDACFRIQREANEIRAARGQPPIPMVVENVRGAEAWVGNAMWNFGSYYLWGNVPALMPGTVAARKVPGFRFDGSGGSFQTASVAEGRKGAGAGAEWFDENLCKLSSKSSARKAASARIAKIPEALSRHIARVYLPAAALGDEIRPRRIGISDI
jgi:hypothetical protein